MKKTGQGNLSSSGTPRPTGKYITGDYYTECGKAKTIKWGKSLAQCPIFTVQDIDDYHRLRSQIFFQKSTKVVKPAIRGE